MKNKRDLFVIGAILFVVLLIYILIPQESNIFSPITDSLFVIIGVIAVILSFKTSRKLKWESMEGKVWLLLCLGYLGWTVGEGIWMFNEVILGIEPYPSAADYFYLLGYIPLLLAIWIELDFVKGAVTVKNFLIASAISGVSLVISCYLIIIPIIVDVDYDIISKILSMTYPVGGLLLILPCIIFFMVFKGSRFSLPWLYVALALTMGAFADSFFAYLDWNGMYEGIYLIIADMLWIADYVFFAYAAHIHNKILKMEDYNSFRILE